LSEAAGSIVEADRPEKESRRRCALCGLPAGRSSLRLPSHPHLDFCCSGCLYVYQVLSSAPGGGSGNFKDSDLYKACTASGLIPRNEEDQLSRQKEGESSMPPEAVDARLDLNLSFRIEGMWCPACSYLIEDVLRKTKGIAEARVSFLSDLAQVRYLPHKIGIEAIWDRVSNLGYRPARIEDISETSPERKDLFLRLGLSSFLTANLMMLSFGLDDGRIKAHPEEGKGPSAGRGLASGRVFNASRRAGRGGKFPGADD